MEDNIIILGTSGFDFKDSETKKQVVGGKIHALTSVISNEKNSSGYIPLVFNVDKEVSDNLSHTVPCLATVTYKMVSGSGGKATLKAVGFNYQETIDIESLFN